MLLTTLLLVGYEYRTQGWTWQTLGVRVGAVTAAWLLALAIYQGLPTVVDGSLPGGEHSFASLGLIVGFALVWAVWSRQNRGLSVRCTANCSS